MGSGTGFFPDLFILAVLGCVPPLLGLLASRRRLVRARQCGVAPGWLQGAMIVSAGAFLLNLMLVTISALSLSEGIGWTRLEAAVLLIGWIAFWLWIVVILLPREHRRREIY
ncbi:MAG TPA: hypothetical protein PLI43_03595 [Albidovulum sp.]|uniref:hypothetical protein n=1 Tax=Albidovulum sp. TaxID=1872424 RepID=UPI002C474CAB|nr:hypothetical protein [Albidovulum sp.]